MAMDQYLYIPFLGGWTSIYQLFWCSPGAQGFDPSPNPNFCRTPMVFLRGIHWFLPMKVPAVAYRARTSSSQFQWRTWLMPRDVKVRQSAEIGCKNEKSISKIRSWSVCCFSQKNEDEQGVSTVGVDVIIGDTFSETWWNSLWDIFSAGVQKGVTMFNIILLRKLPSGIGEIVCGNGNFKQTMTMSSKYKLEAITMRM